MKRCAECGGTLQSVKIEELHTVGEHKIRVHDIPAQKCSACGETYVTGDNARRADLLVADALIGAGIATGEAFRFMRKALGLRAVDLAEMLGVDAATISRWETGKIDVDRGALAALAAAVSEKLAGSNATLDRLKALRDERRPPRTLQVEWSRAS